MAIHQDDCAIGKRELSDFWGISDTSSGLTLILGDPKYPCGPPVTVGAYGDQVIHGILAKVRLTVAPMVPWTHLVAIVPVSEWIIGINILSIWQNPHISSLTCAIRVIMVEKAKWKLLKLPLPTKKLTKSNSLRYCRDYCYHQGLERCRDGDSHHIPI